MKSRVKNVHFIGIGGIGMSGLAEILSASGYRVSGSDLRDSSICQRLRELGVRVEIGHSADHVEAADVVVVSSAVPATNPEIRIAERRHIPVIPRAEMLAELMRTKYGVAITGAHGKTTTTSMVGSVLQAGGLDPTLIVGGHVKTLGSNAHLGSGDILVAEADESDGSFLRLMPSLVVITNIDREHMDHYGHFDRIREAFLDFANRVPFWGAAVLCLDDPHIRKMLPDVTRRTRSYGFSSQAEISADQIETDGLTTRFRVTGQGQELGTVRLQLPGRHNVSNALAAIASGLEFDLPFERIREGLEQFRGVERRFEIRGERDGVVVVDDYAVHPAEIRVILTAARQLSRERIVVAFQPHRYTRMQDLFDELARAFHGADVLLVTDIYSAWEPKIPGVDSERLAQAARDGGQREVHLVLESSAIVPKLRELTRPGDLLLFVGAGDIGRRAGEFLGEESAD